MGNHSEEVQTSFKASPGYLFNDSTFFIINYHLYRKPLGIRRFPDGGTVHTVTEGLFLMEYNVNGLAVREKISDERIPDIDIGFLSGRYPDDTLQLLLPAGIGNRGFIITVSEKTVTIKSHTGDEGKSIVTSDESDLPPGMKSITFTSNLIRENYPVESGLPSPLDYCNKVRNEYIRDLIGLKGDLFYRKEIIRTVGLNDEEILEILIKMDNREKSFDSYKSLEYSINSEDTRKELIK